MCIGRPMQVCITNGYDLAVCEERGQRQKVDISLTPQAGIGDWLLVFLGASRQILSAEQAAEISDALAALEAVNRGDSLDGFFSDLSEREPSLPPHMEAARRAGQKNV